MAVYGLQITDTKAEYCRTKSEPLNNLLYTQISLHQIIIKLCNRSCGNHTAFFHNEKVIGDTASEGELLFHQ